MASAGRTRTAIQHWAGTHRFGSPPGRAIAVGWARVLDRAGRCMHTTPPSLLMRVRDPADHAAWIEFDRRYREWLIRFFQRRNVPFADAEDLVQRVFASLAISLPQFAYDPDRGRFRDYLFRCARNALSDWANCPERRARAVFSWGSLPAVSSDTPDPAASQVWEEEWVNHHYRLALATLRENASPRDVAILERSMAGATPAQLASEFGLSEETVYKARQRIRRSMEALIAAQIAEEDRTDA